MFDRLGVSISRFWVVVLLAWIALAVAVQLLAPNWDDVTHDGDFAYLPAEMPSVLGEDLLHSAFPEIRSKSTLALVVARPNGPLRGADRDVIDWLMQRFTLQSEQDPLIVDVLGPDSPVIGTKLTSRDGRAALIVLDLRDEFMAIDNMDLVKEIYDTLDEIRSQRKLPDGTEVPADLRLEVTGSAAVGYDMLDSAATSIKNTETTTVILVIIVLLLVYRAPGLVVVPLATIGVSVVVAMGVVAMAAQWSSQIDWIDFKIFKTTKIFVIVILFGAGTDYCLFLISRYREELQRGLDPGRAIAVALGQVGDALAASALTTIVGLGMMYFADFGKFRNSGPAIALCLAVALLACISLAPALLRATGKAIFWPFKVGPVEAGQDVAHTRRLGRLWQRLSHVLIARPGLVLVVSVLVLLSPVGFKAFPSISQGAKFAAEGKLREAWSEVGKGFAVPVTYDLLNELQSDRPSVRGTRLMEQHFVAAEIGPVTVLAKHPRGGFDTPAGKRKISRLTKDLFYFEQHVVDADGEETVIEPITAVRSLTNPLGNPPRRSGIFDRRTWDKHLVRELPASRATYRSEDGTVARFDLVFQYDPFSKESIQLLSQVDDHLLDLAADPHSEWHEVEFYYAGTTAGIRDLKAVTASDQFLIQTLVVIAVLFILVLILRRPLICVYLVMSVLLGYFVTISVTELLFSWLYGDTFHGLDWKVPIFLFVILIAIGEDYNIYLATRVFEEQKRLGPCEGLRVAVIRTGGIITSCGVIMAGTFLSMTTGTLRAMHELGFALALGVLLDTFIIRTIVVPAFLGILARREERKVSRVRHDAP